MKRSISALITAFALMMSYDLSAFAGNEGSASGEDTSVAAVSEDADLTSGETVQVVPGDVNSDGAKDIVDVVLTLIYVNGEKMLSDTMLAAADVNADGDVDIVDVVCMLDEIYGHRVAEESTESETDSSQNDESQSDNSQGQQQQTNESEAEYTDDLHELKKTLGSQVSGYKGTWSVYVKNLDTGASFEINNKPVYAASLIKLYAMGDAYRKIENGNLSKTQLASYMKSMITVSDNNSFNYIVDKVGAGDITKWCKANGFDQTVQAHKLPNYYYDRPYNYGENKTSVADTGKLLEQIYKGELVSKQASKEMYDLLLAQERRSKIPAGLPWGTNCANKTGETDDYCHDAAIISTKGADYILVVMVENKGNAYSSNANVANVSRTVYNYFNM